MRVQVVVTQEDIDAGRPRESNSCPVALAFSRIYPDYQSSVGTTNRTFDNGDLVRPIVFQASLS